MDQLDDKDVIEKHFITEYRHLVKSMKFITDNNEFDAEDVVMEAFTRALKYRKCFNDINPFSHWFNRILANCFRDWKREKFNHSDYVNEYDEDEVEHKEDIHFEKQFFKKLLSDINKLNNPEHQEVNTLYFIYGFSIREIVQITNQKYGNVVLITQRFKNRMKEKYE